MEREKWEREVRIAFCIDHIITDIRPQERADIISKVEPPKGLLLTFHGGFVQLLVYWLQSHGAMIASRADDNANLLFSMLRTLQDGGTVLMAPDARFGELKSSIKVLGKDHQIADGAAFLAYQTRCPVAWCMIARDDDRFVPVIRSMQVGDETYEAFKARFFQFYAEQIEQIITGDPRNLALKAQWAPPPGKRSPGAARRLGRDAR
jgi:hypothetical protein